MIELKNVFMSYKVGEKSQTILHDIDLKIEAGKLVVILGPSGAGKTTLLNLMAGLAQATAGKILVAGEDITNYRQNKMADFRAKNIAVVFQAYNLLPALTVWENVAIVEELPRNGNGVVGSADEAIRAVGLSRLRNKFPAQMSGGEQQRVSIARAINQQAKVLLCDEPTGALDSETGVKVLKLLKRQTELGSTVVIVTHNTLFAEVADMVVKIKNGEIEKIIENKKPKMIEEVVW